METYSIHLPITINVVVNVVGKKGLSHSQIINQVTHDDLAESDGELTWDDIKYTWSDVKHSELNIVNSNGDEINV